MKVEWSQPCDPESWDTSPDCCIEWHGRREGGFDPLFVLWERDLHGRVTWGIWEIIGRGMVPKINCPEKSDGWWMPVQDPTLKCGSIKAGPWDGGTFT